MSDGKKTTPPNQNHTGALVSSLLTSGDAWVKLLTLALVIFTGTSNWFATQNLGHESRYEWQQAMKEIHQFFNNQQTYLQGLQLLQQNNQDTAWIRNTLQQNGAVSRSNHDELAALKDEIAKLKAELAKPVEQRNFK